MTPTHHVPAERPSLWVHIYIKVHTLGVFLIAVNCFNELVRPPGIYGAAIYLCTERANHWFVHLPYIEVFS